MKKDSQTKFHALRIYLTSTILYFFLVLPFIGFLVLQNLPETLKEANFKSKIQINNAESAIDSTLTNTIDTIVGDIVNFNIQSEEQINATVDSIIASVVENTPNQAEEIEHVENNKNLKQFFKLFFKFLSITYLLGFLFNLPFKIYLKRRRKHKEIKLTHNVYCKKLILYTPLINCLILFLPHLVSHYFALSTVLSSGAFIDDVERNIFENFLAVSIVAASLTLLFVFFWQKNRVHLKYIDFFYSEEELRKRIFRSKRGNIGRQLWFASIITTFFPLAIVMLYIILSLTSVKDLKLGNINPDQKEVLLGNWNNTIDLMSDQADYNSNFEGLYYVTAIDTIVMFVGIGTGIMISIFYLLLIVKWTTRSIVTPVNELLDNMKKIRKDGISDYTIVRTNDEVGELAEGFNIMVDKIKNYIYSISQMNMNLENKVVERTKEIAEQKEEIMSQKEEIESQLDMVIHQKDTIEGQKYQILDSIHYAKRIQTAILPPEDMLKKSLSDYFVLYIPRDIVSGDFYWNMEKDNKVYIAVGDCTGHGVPGAFLSILGISYLNEILNKVDVHNAGEILGQLRESLISSLHQKGKEGETQDGLEIALCILDLENKTMQYSGANRPLYLIRKINENNKPSTQQANDNVQTINKGDYKLLKYKPDNMPIGIYNDTVKSFTNNDISLLSGDSIYLFTDGYVDQMGGPNRKTYRVKYFRDLLFKIQDKEMSDQRKVLDQTIKEWRGERDQTDDILVMGIKI